MVLVYLILVIVVVFLLQRNSISNFKAVEVDGEYFKTHGALKNNAKAASLMATINNNVIRLLKYLIKKGEDKKPEVMRLLQRYNWENMFENSPFNTEGSTSYMESKGKKFVMCLRNKKGEFIDMNTLMFVAIHELSHLMTLTYDNHGPEFWKFMKYLLKHAIDLGIYKYVDYSKYPINYCGLPIYHNPLNMSFL